MAALTKKQQEIYDYLQVFLKQYGYAPSLREIAAQVDLKSASTVNFHMKTLRELGLIDRAPGKTRSLYLPKAAPTPKGIPILGHVAAGAPILAQEHIEDYLDYRPTGGAEDLFALRVRGESMKDAGILPGDLILVAPCHSARNGQIVVALFEDEATVKTYERSSDGSVWLLPANPDFSPIDGAKAQIVGRVCSVVREY